MVPVRVLVADDDPDATVALAELLKTLNCEVEVAHSGTQAVRTATEFQPEVVILDIEMPGMNGCEAALTLRQQAWATGAVFVAFTAATSHRIAQRIKECGFQHHFLKPTPFERFAALIECIRRREGRSSP